jgi:hypothetical protein
VKLHQARKQREAAEAISGMGGYTDDWVGWQEIFGHEYAPVIEGSLRDTETTDSTLKHLRLLPYLEYLDLAGTEVSDDGLDHLKGLTNLRSLDLTDTNVTPEGMNRLQEALPDCEIEY